MLKARIVNGVLEVTQDGQESIALNLTIPVNQIEGMPKADQPASGAKPDIVLTINTKTLAVTGNERVNNFVSEVPGVIKRMIAAAIDGQRLPGEIEIRIRDKSKG